MSHPLVVEAAEALFHPVAIRNNVEGYEGEIRERFKEPSWNNPVLRFIDKDAKDILPRKDRQWSLSQVVQRMASTLKEAKQTTPGWLSTLAAETASGEVETAYFAMT